MLQYNRTRRPTRRPQHNYQIDPESSSIIYIYICIYIKHRACTLSIPPYTNPALSLHVCVLDPQAQVHGPPGDDTRATWRMVPAPVAGAGPLCGQAVGGRRWWRAVGNNDMILLYYYPIMILYDVILLYDIILQ